MLLFSRVTTWLVIAFLAGLAAALLYWPLTALFAHIPLSYNEGWNGLHSLRLRTGGPLYPPIDASTFINYPPLSFYLTAVIAIFTGDDIGAGRLLALAALAITTLNVGLAVRRLAAPLEIALATALAFFCFAALYFTDYVAVDDPQWLAHAFQSTGLVVLLGSRRDWRTLIVVAALMVAGGLVKHNVLALPLAVTLWLAFEDRRALLRWLIAAAAIGAAALLLCLGLYGTNFIDQVIRSGRTYTLDVLILVLQMQGPHLAPFVIAAAIGAWLSRRDPLSRLIAIYLVVALVVGIALMTGSGVLYNPLFDLVIAMLSPNAMGAYASVTTDLARQPEWTATIERIRTTPGPVACETLALCYWAGRPSEIEFFNFGQRVLLDPGFDAAFAQQLERGDIALIQRELTGGARRLPPDLEALIETHYKLETNTPTALYVPR